MPNYSLFDEIPQQMPQQQMPQMPMQPMMQQFGAGSGQLSDMDRQMMQRQMMQQQMMQQQMPPIDPFKMMELEIMRQQMMNRESGMFPNDWDTTRQMMQGRW